MTDNEIDNCLEKGQCWECKEKTEGRTKTYLQIHGTCRTRLIEITRSETAKEIFDLWPCTGNAFDIGIGCVSKTCLKHQTMKKYLSSKSSGNGVE